MIYHHRLNAIRLFFSDPGMGGSGEGSVTVTEWPDEGFDISVFGGNDQEVLFSLSHAQAKALVHALTSFSVEG